MPPGAAEAALYALLAGIGTAFLLVPQVKLPKRQDLARDSERAHDALPGLIVANWMEDRL
jgi:hypothetical protein